MVDQVSAHSSTCYSEKMPSVLPILIFGGYQPEVDLVHQLGGLQGVALALTLHQVVRQAPQVREHQGEELVFRFAASIAPPMQELRDVSHILLMPSKCVQIIARGWWDRRLPPRSGSQRRKL